MLRKIWHLLGNRSGGRRHADETAEHVDPVLSERPIPPESLDPDAVKIVQRLTRYEHEAYLVGGCVRDLLLGRQPKDFDIGTSATPRQIKRLFRNCRIIGRRFRLAHIYFAGGKVIEVATFRSGDDDNTPPADGDVMIRDDNRFGTVEQDALRRDFTINQLFYDCQASRVIDHTNGLGDLERRLIRTIGEPALRFREDPIRILRAIKFAARLDFDIEKTTRAALLETRDDIPKAAPPRVLEEINRFCRGGAARRSFELLRDTGVFDVILPEFRKPYAPGVGDEAWNTLLQLLEALDRRHRDDEPNETGLIVACLLLPVLWTNLGWAHDGAAPERRSLRVREWVEEWLQPLAVRLRISRREQERCRQILTVLARLVPESDVRPRTRASLLSRPCLPECLSLLEILAEHRGGEFATSLATWQERLERGEADDARAGSIEGEDESGTRPPRRRRRRRRGKRSGRGRGGEGARPEGRRDELADDRPDEASGVDRDGRADRRDDRERREDGDRAPRRARKSGPAPRKKWGGDSFFDALPSVPDDQLGGQGEPNRYGGGDRLSHSGEPEFEVADEVADGSGEASGDGAPDDGAAPKRKRRRRRRKRSWRCGKFTRCRRSLDGIGPRRFRPVGHRRRERLSRGSIGAERTSGRFAGKSPRHPLTRPRSTLHNSNDGSEFEQTFDKNELHERPSRSSPRAHGCRKGRRPSR